MKPKTHKIKHVKDLNRPQVFIIESLRLEDETAERFEGKFLSQLLRFGGKKPYYYYIRTKNELEAMLPLFAESHYRYLHFSCHGSESMLGTTLNNISFHEFGRLLQPYLDGKRLFVSACASVNKDLASEIFPESGCLSIIGPRKEINFDDSAIAWATFYHMIFKENFGKMTRDTITHALKTIRTAYGVYMSYYKGDKDSSCGFKRVKWLARSECRKKDPR